jgi:HD-GYP domain-containing protein (c-di-GMP phosphodiesterase class II)
MTRKSRFSISNALFGPKRESGISLLIVALLALGVTLLVYATGGTKYVYVQFMYAPVILAGILFRLRGGLAMAACAGLLLGPLMPLEVARDTPQETTSWLIRMGFFALNGSVAGGLSTLIVERLRLFEKISDELAITYGNTLRALVMLIGERDDETADHSERVAFNTLRLGQALHLDQQQLETLYWASILHDLGKIGVSENILNKPGPLSPQERLDMQRHAEIGQRVIMNAGADFKPIADIVVAHHERWDGHGYPHGLKGEAIPLEARILTVIDVFEAITSKRPYHEPLDPQTAMQQICAERGKHFDPRVAETFHQLFLNQQLMFENEHSALSQQRDRYSGAHFFLSRINARVQASA